MDLPPIAEDATHRCFPTSNRRMTGRAYLNRVGTAVPAHDLHAQYVAFARDALTDERAKRGFDRLARKAQIEHRYVVVPLDGDPGGRDFQALFLSGRMPDTALRMRLYEDHVLPLAERAIERLGTERLRAVTHVIVTSCTGFSAPGIDLQIAARFGLRENVERTVVGFMGCSAALNALKLARHAVRSDPDALVLVVNVELCSLHLQRPNDAEHALGFLLFADGCAASLVSAEPEGLELEDFACALLPDSGDAIGWRVGALGFDLRLSLDVPRVILAALEKDADRILGSALDDVALWAVHPGGRAILDAVETGLALEPGALAPSRDVLRRFGNMSSASIVFVLAHMFGAARGSRGMALAFGPGVVCESLRFRVA